MTALNSERLCASRAVTLPQRRHRPHWTQIAEFVLTAIGVIVAGLVVGFFLAIPG